MRRNIILSKQKKTKSKPVQKEKILAKMQEGLEKYFKEDPERQKYLRKVQERYSENPVDYEFDVVIQDSTIEVLAWYEDYVYQNELVWNFYSLAEFIMLKLMEDLMVSADELDKDYVLNIIERVLYQEGYYEVR